MFFYAIFAIALATRRSVYIVVAPVLVACAALSLFRVDPVPAWTYYFDPIVLEFLGGMLIAETILRGQKPPLWISSILFAGGFVYLLTSPDSQWMPRVVNCGLPAAMIVYGTVWLEPVIGPHIPKWLLYLGSASYSIYLFHPLVAPAGAVVLHRLHVMSPAGSVALCWMIGVGCGSLAYRFVEPRLRFYRPNGSTIGHERKLRLRPRLFPR